MSWYCEGIILSSGASPGHLGKPSTVPSFSCCLHGTHFMGQCIFSTFFRRCYISSSCSLSPQPKALPHAFLLIDLDSYCLFFLMGLSAPSPGKEKNVCGYICVCAFAENINFTTNKLEGNCHLSLISLFIYLFIQQIQCLVPVLGTRK